MNEPISPAQAQLVYQEVSVTSRHRRALHTVIGYATVAKHLNPIVHRPEKAQRHLRAALFGPSSRGGLADFDLLEPGVVKAPRIVERVVIPSASEGVNLRWESIPNRRQIREVRVELPGAGRVTLQMLHGWFRCGVCWLTFGGSCRRRPNGPRLSCGRLARRRKGVRRQSAPARAQTLRFL